MKEVFTSVQDRITAQVAAIRWTDFDLGQLEQVPPPVSWPCALIDFSAATVEPSADLAGSEVLRVDVTLGFKLRERTHSKANQTYRDEALTHMDTVEAVRVALEGLSGASFAALTYSGFTRDRRTDYRVYRLSFTCTRYPETPDDGYVPWVDGGGAGIGPGFCVHPDIE